MAIAPANARTGKFLWRVPVRGDFQVFSGMVLDGETLYGQWAARNHHAYDATFGGVDNELDSTTVHKGAFVEGWVVFDVGNSPLVQIQYAPNYGGDVLSYWTVKV